MNQYCVYLTFYSGSKLPPYYIGSTSIANIEMGYRGTVSSLKYRKIWKTELKENPHLFKTQIVRSYSTRIESLEHENKLQRYLKVIKSTMYINQAYASPSGSHGRDVKGENNPMFNKHHSDDTREKQRNKAKGKAKSKESVLKRTKTVNKFWSSDTNETKLKRKMFSELNSGENNGMYGKRGEDNPNFGRKAETEEKKNKSKAAKNKIKSKNHIRHMSRAYVLESENTGIIFTGYGLNDFCQKIGIGQPLFLYHMKSGKFKNGFRILEKKGMCLDPTLKSLSELMELLL